MRGRTRLGRAGDSDIQILHDGVSRQHAQVIEDNAGNAVLMDLASNNGTFVGEQRVTRHRLSPGDEFRIMRTRFVFEEVEDEDDDALDETSPVFAVKVHTSETHRRTVDHWQLDLPAPRDRSSSGISVAEGGDRQRVVANYPDGSAYTGDVLGDILEYRALRLRSLRGDAMSDDEVRRFGALQGALHQPSGDPDRAAAARRFCRLRCALPARLRHGEHFGDRTARVSVVDLSAGGAKVACPGTALEVGQLVWLVIDLVVGRRPRTIVLTARIVTAQGDDYGLLFAGAPEWDLWRPAS